jgi:hypothetical protein
LGFVFSLLVSSCASNELTVYPFSLVTNGYVKLHPLEKVSTQKQLPLTAAGPNNTLETAETPLINKPLSPNIYGRVKTLIAKLGTRPNLGKNAAQMGDATGEVSDASGSTCVLKNFYPDNGGERDKGPWSREAFDLFDWNPSIEAPTTANR